MKVILKNHTVINKKVQKPGVEVDIETKQAKRLIEKGFAVKPGQEFPVVETEVDNVDTGDADGGEPEFGPGE